MRAQIHQRISKPIRTVKIKTKTTVKTKRATSQTIQLHANKKSLFKNTPEKFPEVFLPVIVKAVENITYLNLPS